MPAPATTNDFIELVQKSGVVDGARLAAYLQSLRDRGTLPGTPTATANALVRDGIITLFQAEQLLLGKWKRFTIGKYKVLERIGTGGMGQVFLCEHKLMRRRVAVKVLPSAKADDEAALERFHREGRAAASLDHPNLVRAFDIDQDQSLHFLVMEYIDGTSLHHLVKNGGRLSPLRACHYIRQAALGLQYAFECAGLVHRDIKPGNILVDRLGIVKILDMGLARFFYDEQDILTRKYDETLGTADYLAPEQAVDSHCVDARADIYSLGATFYFLLTGSPPFAEGTVAQKLMWHQTRQPTPIREIRTDVPPAIVAIIERMMAKDPARRYSKPAEVAEALEPFVQTPIAPPTDAELPRLSPAARAAIGPAGSSPGRIVVPRPTATASVETPTRLSQAIAANAAGAPAATAVAPAVGLSGDYNPYTNLRNSSGPPSPIAQHIYATALHQADARLKIPSPSAARTRWLWPIVIFTAVTFVAGWAAHQAGFLHFGRQSAVIQAQ